VKVCGPIRNKPSSDAHRELIERDVAWSHFLNPEVGMFDVLIASGAHLELRPRLVTTSVVTHAIIITLAVVATQAAVDAPPVVPESAILLYVPKAPEPPPPETKPEATPPKLVIAEPPPKGFQTVATLEDIPTVIPPVDLTQRPLDPRDFTGRGVEGGLANGVVGGTGKVDVPEDFDAIYEATTSDARFDQAVLVSQPTPRYPQVLETARLEGRVAFEFVIDTVGRVQPSSIRILESTHEAFSAAARTAVTAAIFEPARLSGHPVRQLTRQAIRFVTAH
jgi:TonB family protein